VLDDGAAHSELRRLNPTAALLKTRYQKSNPKQPVNGKLAVSLCFIRVSIKSVTECQWQMGKAWQQAEFRKLVPDAFDEMGKMRPGQLARVLIEFGKHHPGKALVI